jgi:hypothetical protein
MQYEFILLEDFFKSWQAEYINLLDQCGLLGKFTPDCKKLLMYMFITKLNNTIHDSKCLFYHIETLSPCLEIFDYIEFQKFNIFFNKLALKIRKLTGRIFFISQSKSSLIKQVHHINEMDGCIQDEVLLLQHIKFSPKKLKELLSQLNLKDLFKDMVWQCE